MIPISLNMNLKLKVRYHSNGLQLECFGMCGLRVSIRFLSCFTEVAGVNQVSEY